MEIKLLKIAIICLLIIISRCFAWLHEQLHAVVVRKLGGNPSVNWKRIGKAYIVPNIDLEPLDFAKVCMFPFILIVIPIILVALNIWVLFASVLLVLILPGGLGDIKFTIIALKNRKKQVLIRSGGRYLDIIDKYTGKVIEPRINI